MSEERKMLFFDIDGTLITDDSRKYMPDSAKYAIAKARENGHLTFINTGRVFVNIEDFIRNVGFDGYVCGCGTNIIIDGKDVLHNFLTKEKCREIALMCREYDMMAIFEFRDHTAFDREIKGSMHREILSYFKSMNRKLIDDIYDEEFIFDKFAFWHESKNTRIKEFLNYLKGDFTCIDRGNNFYEIVPMGFSKATGIDFLCRYFDVPIDNVYVFGDSNNDIDMLKAVKHSIAMGVCSDEVARIASYRTSRVEDDGIYNAMKNFGVI